MDRRKLIAIIIVVFGVMFTSGTFYFYQVVYVSNLLVDQEDTYLYLGKEATFKSVQDSLYNNNLVHDLVAFSFLAKLMDYDNQVKPGRYLFKKDMSNIEAIRLLRSGNQAPVRITFNSIRFKKDLVDKITRNLNLSAAELDNSLNDFIDNNNYGFNQDNIISVFIPNTYEVYWNISADGLIERMVQEYNKFWDDERLSKAGELQMTPIEIAILASIVQAEQQILQDEWKTIAGLYINRLKRRMKLDSDPTVVFAIGDFSISRVLEVHKQVDSPYNTYLNRGLPPGPITMPSISTIDAVLNYQEHRFLYMCAREDFSGYHRFATNLQDHLINARRYQRQLSIEQRKARQNQ